MGKNSNLQVRILKFIQKLHVGSTIKTSIVRKWISVNSNDRVSTSKISYFLKRLEKLGYLKLEEHKKKQRKLIYKIIRAINDDDPLLSSLEDPDISNISIKLVDNIHDLIEEIKVDNQVKKKLKSNLEKNHYPIMSYDPDLYDSYIKILDDHLKEKLTISQGNISCSQGNQKHRPKIEESLESKAFDDEIKYLHLQVRKKIKSLH